MKEELALHHAVADLLTRSARQNVVWWHTNNNSNSARRGAALKRMGVLAGVADFIVIVGRLPQPPRIAFLELKTEKGSLSKTQRFFCSCVVGTGCLYEVARDIDEAIEFLSDIEAIRVEAAARFSPKVRVA